MPVIHLEHLDAEITRKQLLEAVKAMTPEERRAFMTEVLSLQPGAAPASLTAKESDLLERINSGPRQEQWARFHELTERRREETITEAEQVELLKLIDVVEEFQAVRVEALAELSRLRGLSLAQLMESLGIKSPGYV
jgi:hypothetical protein